MKKSRHLFLSCASLIVAAMVGFGAQAAPFLETTAVYAVGGATVTTDSASGPPPSTISSVVTITDGFTVDFSGDANARAVSTSGAGAVLADGVFASGESNFELAAGAIFGETVTNNTGVTQDYFFDFNVLGPRLEIADFVFGPDATIQYAIEIQVNGATIWDSAAVLFGGGTGFALTQTGTDLGASFFCLNAGCTEASPGSRFGYTFGAFSDRLSLGAFADGDSFTLQTTMAVSVDALPFEFGGLASIGDPNSIGATPGVSGAVSAGVVPVPAAVWLFGSGLLGLIAVARRRAA
jgi:hypothetical protein